MATAAPAAKKPLTKTELLANIAAPPTCPRSRWPPCWKPWPPKSRRASATRAPA